MPHSVSVQQSLNKLCPQQRSSVVAGRRDCPVKTQRWWNMCSLFCWLCEYAPTHIRHTRSWNSRSGKRRRQVVTTQVRRPTHLSNKGAESFTWVLQTAPQTNTKQRRETVTLSNPGSIIFMYVSIVAVTLGVKFVTTVAGVVAFHSSSITLIAAANGVGVNDRQHRQMVRSLASLLLACLLLECCSYYLPQPGICN